MGAILSGTLGAVLMSIVWMGASLSRAEETLTVFRLISESVSLPGVAFLGILIHWGVSLLISASFVLLSRKKLLGQREQPLGDQTMTAAIVFGVVIWAFSTFLILPFLDSSLHLWAVQNSGWWLSAHLVFSFGLGTAGYFRRKFAGPTQIIQEVGHWRRAS